MNQMLVGRVLYPFHEWAKGKTTFPWFRRLEESQWWPLHQLRDYQDQRLRHLLSFAARHVPYYSRVLAEHGISPEDIHSTDDLRRLPFLTRAMVHEHFDALRSRVPRRGTQRISTGGSTGEPATILVDMERMGFGEGSRLRAQRWLGVEPGDREIVLWGSPIETGRQDIIRATRDRLLNSRLLSAFDLSEAALARYADVIASYQPVKMYGYASAVHLLARFLRSTNRRLPRSLRAIFTTAEPLFDFQRAEIEAAFECRVGTEYGARDAGLIASECQDGRLHIPAEGIHVEIVDPDADGIGEIAVTVLDSMVFPTIRYRTGDIGSLDPSPCSCGRSLPSLRAVEGRQTDFLVKPQGGYVHALAVIYPLRGMAGIRAFQVVQEEPDLVRVSIVPDAGFPAQRDEDVRTAIRAVLGPTIRVKVDRVDAINRTRSGKFRYVVSHVAAMASR